MFVCDIDADALGIIRKGTARRDHARCDVADRREVEDMVAFGVAALGGLDVLVNNAGIAGPTAPVETMDPDEWEKVVAVNLNGTFNVTRCAIPHLKQSTAGVDHQHVVGRRPARLPQPQPLCDHQMGAIGFTKTLSMELGEFGIRVNAILPGAVAGQRLDRVYEARAKAGGQSVDEIKTRALAQPIAEGVRRSARRRGAGRVPGVRCGEVDLGPDSADRRRPAADDVTYPALVTKRNSRSRSLSSFGPISSSRS